MLPILSKYKECYTCAVCVSAGYTRSLVAYRLLMRLLAAEPGSKDKIFFGQQPPSGESTTKEYGFNYQLLAVID